MSFFGFDTNLPRDKQDRDAGRGFFAGQQDAFAFANRDTADQGDVLNFDDTYDNLADKLDEAGDAFNDDTFGDGGRVGKDFDFFGTTNKVAGTLEEEQALHYARQPPPAQQRFQHQQQQSKPSRSGYENYSKPEYIPQLEANASIWGLPSKKPAQEPQIKPSTPSSRKMMSLEEVEASMRAQSRPLSGAMNMPQHHTPVQEPFHAPGSSFSGVQQMQQQTPRQPSREPQMASPFPQPQHMPVQPPPGMQNPGLIAQQLQQQMPPTGPPSGPPPGELGHGHRASYSGPPITQANQMMQLSDEQRA
ncbi:hypothetical protein KCU64_g21307, partial [Aureobasidium melanogenum]